MRIIFPASLALLLSIAATAQEQRSEISLQGTGFFTRDVTANGTSYSSTNSGGLLGTYRFHINRWLSAEGAYGYTDNSQKYFLSSDAFRIDSRIHQMTGAFVVNLPSRPSSRFQPYVLAGGGALVFSPNGNQFNTISGAQSQTKGAFVYGAGVNFAAYKKLSIRAEYRGLVYTSPDFGFGAFNINSTTHTAIPSVGITYRF
jgi:outer membrane autotransporter protein